MVELLNTPINDRFYDLVSSSKSDIRLCAPYVKNQIVQKIYSLKRQSVNIEFLSNLSLPNLYKKSSDIEAFETIANRNDKIYNCQMLHAKIYIFDDNKTIITSANLTHSGFKRNIEYGVYIDSPDLVYRTLVDYKTICNNEKTGKIKAKNIRNIRGILDQLPEYKDKIGPINDINETDDSLVIDKELILNQLSDWKKAMFLAVDSLENNRFSLSEIYKKEDDFKNQFPNNNTIRDSMRRNLQELRDLGLIKFHGDGSYKKLWR